jgi:hypothetical protein
MYLPRMTTRRWMIAVAVVAVVLWGVPTVIQWRRIRFQRLSDYHRSKIVLVGPPSPLLARTLYHSKMAEKYAEATRRPWLPVSPDPPAPPVGAEPQDF